MITKLCKANNVWETFLLKTKVSLSKDFFFKILALDIFVFKTVSFILNIYGNMIDNKPKKLKLLFSILNNKFKIIQIIKRKHI